MDKQKVLELTRDRADDFYLDAFRRIESGKRIIWNWGAFFGTFVWMFYRKMYKRSLWYSFLNECFLWCLIYFFFEGSLGKGFFWTPFTLFTLFSIWCGLFGTKMYYKHIQKKMQSRCYENHDNKPATNGALYCYFFYWLAKFAWGIIPFLIAISFRNNTATGKFIIYESFCGAPALFLGIICLIAFLCRKLSSKKSKESSELGVKRSGVLSLISSRSEEYYWKKFQDIEKGKIISVNGNAFWCGILWFIYKRMYGLAIIVSIPIFLEALLKVGIGEETSSVLSLINSLIQVIILPLGGANRLYRRHIMKQIAKEQRTPRKG